MCKTAIRLSPPSDEMMTYIETVECVRCGGKLPVVAVDERERENSHCVMALGRPFHSGTILSKAC